MPIWMWIIYCLVLGSTCILIIIGIKKNYKTKKILKNKLKKYGDVETSNFKIYIKNGRIFFLKKDTGYRNYLDDAGPVKEEIYSELRSIFENNNV